MAEVYVARDEQSEQRVAVKVLRPELIKERRYLRRFAVEVAANRRAAGEHLVGLQDAGLEQGLPFLVMDWVRGPSLWKWVQERGPLEPGLALSLFRQAALGLAAMHEQGIFHRDVKPANILVDLDGSVPVRARISDLGLARLASIRGITRTGAAVGSPAFMAPEQVAADEADARTDVYGWGMSLLYAVTAELPFEGSTRQVMLHQLRTKPPPPSWLMDGQGEALDRIVLCALRKHPDNRYQSMLDVVEDTEAAERGAARGVPLRITPDEYVPKRAEARRWLASASLDR
jgi:serine/threonine-protein kinase